MMAPKIEEGQKVTIFGVRAVVTEVVPASDWAWHVTLSSVSVMGNAEVWTITVPTDKRTTDGRDVRSA